MVFHGGSTGVNGGMLVVEVVVKRNDGGIGKEVVVRGGMRLSCTFCAFWIAASSTWMEFGGNTRDLGSFGEETDEIIDLHQILEEVLLTERGDDVIGIKRRRCDPSVNSVRDLVTASRRSRLNEDLESSI
ncbi:hypothetical protein Tco_1544691 [Tanacetum coccineum]